VLYIGVLRCPPEMAAVKRPAMSFLRLFSPSKKIPLIWKIW